MGLLNLIEKKRNEQKRQAQKKTTKTLVFGVTIGAIAGAISGVLLAPKSGSENIEDLKNLTRGTGLKDKAKVAKNNISEAREKIKDYLKNKKTTSEVKCKLPNEKEIEKLVDEKIEVSEENN
ncbi:YtxH domain-containing protein [Clostridium sardiniense]|uniref:YtxH domain-containing protein n=1 Tax=Clostridium sardiniense TaxID=29369 RepID=UPI00195E0456|nr:YtxH domain-containing protein [Clostridium sardiniense]MBM7835594.1 gas vesicle protein [Clostridium sardiniense]